MGFEVNVEAIVVCECIWFMWRICERRIGLVNSVKNVGIGAKTGRRKLVDIRLLRTFCLKVLFERSDPMLR